MKQIRILDKLKFIIFAALVACATTSCEYKEIAEVSFSDQKIYLPSASVASLGIGGNGIYSINAVAAPGQSFRYAIDNSSNKFDIPLGVYRSGAKLVGAVNVNITTPPDTITKLIASNFLANTVILPGNSYSIQQSVTVKDGSDFEPFILSVDLPYLLANINTNHAIAVRVASPNVASNTTFGTVIIVINPAFLVPTSQFTSILDGKSVSFNNTSINGVSYSWNFGDGSPAVTTKSPTHVYAAAGSYNVTLTTVGALGVSNQVTSTNVVVVP